MELDAIGRSPLLPKISPQAESRRILSSVERLLFRVSFGRFPRKWKPRREHSQTGMTTMVKFNQPLDAAVEPRCTQPATFMRLPYIKSSKDLDIALFGVPFDLGSTNRNGPRLGPS